LTDFDNIWYLFVHKILEGILVWYVPLQHCATSRKVAGSIPDGVIGFFFIDIIFPAALWPWGRISL